MAKSKNKNKNINNDALKILFENKDAFHKNSIDIIIKKINSDKINLDYIESMKKLINDRKNNGSNNKITHPDILNNNSLFIDDNIEKMNEIDLKINERNSKKSNMTGNMIAFKRVEENSKLSSKSVIDKSTGIKYDQIRSMFVNTNVAIIPFKNKFAKER